MLRRLAIATLGCLSLLANGCTLQVGQKSSQLPLEGPLAPAAVYLVNCDQWIDNGFIQGGLFHGSPALLAEQQKIACHLLRPDIIARLQASGAPLAVKELPAQHVPLNVYAMGEWAEAYADPAFEAGSRYRILVSSVYPHGFGTGDFSTTYGTIVIMVFDIKSGTFLGMAEINAQSPPEILQRVTTALTGPRCPAPGLVAAVSNACQSAYFATRLAGHAGVEDMAPQ
jgi:hypothetical protein